MGGECAKTQEHDRYVSDILVIDTLKKYPPVSVIEEGNPEIMGISETF
jgi:hypothetical protein